MIDSDELQHQQPSLGALRLRRHRQRRRQGDPFGATQMSSRLKEPPLSCMWCGQAYQERQTGGRTQRFCRPSCRRHYHAAVRQWTLAAIARGDLTIADIRTGVPATRALPAGAISTGVAGPAAAPCA